MLAITGAHQMIGHSAGFYFSRFFLVVPMTNIQLCKAFLDLTTRKKKLPTRHVTHTTCAAGQLTHYNAVCLEQLDYFLVFRCNISSYFIFLYIFFFIVTSQYTQLVIFLSCKRSLLHNC